MIDYRDKLSDVFDAIDQQILRILRTEGRASHAMIAKDVGLSAPAVGERIRKLEQVGVITGYGAVFDPEKIGVSICAFVAISPQPRKPGASLVKSLLELPEIEELHAVAGQYSYIAKVRVGNTEELDAFLDRLFMLEGVERTETTMVLKTNIERPMHLPFI
ncbi:MAG: Lrp/AsnC family transcriptional regulator [Trueperaceae bacterium]|nr:MAG: Lrp/AsnC family transcriptional regulator [Trueperaceae bacterium]